jgi:hypothetical protein
MRRFLMNSVNALVVAAMNYVGAYEVKRETANEHKDDIRICVHNFQKTLQIRDQYRYCKETENVTSEDYEPTMNLLHGFTTGLDIALMI